MLKLHWVECSIITSSCNLALMLYPYMNDERSSELVHHTTKTMHGLDLASLTDTVASLDRKEKVKHSIRKSISNNNHADMTLYNFHKCFILTFQRNGWWSKFDKYLNNKNTSIHSLNLILSLSFFLSVIVFILFYFFIYLLFFCIFFLFLWVFFCHFSYCYVSFSMHYNYLFFLHKTMHLLLLSINIMV